MLYTHLLTDHGLKFTGMVIPPIIMVKLEKNFLKRNPKLAAPIQVSPYALSPSYRSQLFIEEL